MYTTPEVHFQHNSIQKDFLTIAQLIGVKAFFWIVVLGGCC